ncbi:MAG TPA: 2-hydroxyacyl-CoA dehydratase family protein [Candidatus Anoxymicrobiaceae bacterium]
MTAEEIRKPPKIAATEQMKQLITNYYIEAKTTEEKPICWITSGGPVEFLIAMGVIPVYPENHGAMCGASKIAVGLAEIAEGMGFSQDICSYARLDIGAATTGGGAIPGGLPKPDFLLCCNNICGTVVKWYEELSRIWDVPMFLFDTPFIHGSKPEHATEYVKQQCLELIEFLEEQTGKKWSEERFEEVALLSVEGVDLWKEVLTTAESRPSPFTCFDAFIHMAPIVTLRGTQEVVDYYKLLRDEMQDRVANGIGAVPDEKYRLIWDNIPIWYEMRNLGNLFAGNGACLVADTYTTAWAVDIRIEDPLTSMADAYTKVYLNISIDLMLEQLSALMERFSADGLVMHSNRSCKPYSLGQYDLARAVTERTGKPALIIEADMTDSRAYSEAQTRERVEAFIESLR